MFRIDLTGKVAVITGGSRGIGRAISVTLANAGADILVNFLRNVDAAQETKSTIEAMGRRCEVVRGNIGDPNTALKIRETAQIHFGKVDILILNAASGVLRRFWEMNLKHFRWTFEANVFGHINLVRELLPLMNEGSKIVGISSIGTSRAIPYYSFVGASKGALESALRHLALELSPKKINVNIVELGAVETDALKFFPNHQQLILESKRRTPLGRLVSPQDAANVVLFLCSDLSDMIQGQTIIVDGGYSIAP